MQAQGWPSIRTVLVYASLVGKVARATLLNTLYQTISSNLQIVSVVSATLATEFIRRRGIEMLSELRLVYHGALRRTFRRPFNVAASNDRSSSLCYPPS
jgi:hypothetical protein